MPEEKLQTLSLQVINGSELESGSRSREMSAMAPNATGRYRIVSRAFRLRPLPLSCTMAHFVCARRRHNCG